MNEDTGRLTGSREQSPAVSAVPASIPSAITLPYSRSSYEGEGGWKDGRLGQVYDLLCAVLQERGERPFGNPLLAQIENLDASHD